MEDLPDDPEKLKQYIDYLLDELEHKDRELRKSEQQVLELKQELDKNPGMTAQELEGYKELLEALEELKEKVESTGVSEEHRRKREKDQDFIDRYTDDE